MMLSFAPHSILSFISDIKAPGGSILCIDWTLRVCVSLSRSLTLSLSHSGALSLTRSCALSRTFSLSFPLLLRVVFLSVALSSLSFSLFPALSLSRCNVLYFKFLVCSSNFCCVCIKLLSVKRETPQSLHIWPPTAR